MIRLRYAPSPTGNLHIGAVRTALFNYLLAKHYNGKFIVRIEDTDLKRNVKGSEEKILEQLKWLNIDIDETIGTKNKFGPYKQSKRFDIYKNYAKELIDKNFAYYCFCTTYKEEKKKVFNIEVDSCRCFEKKISKKELERNNYSIKFKIKKDIDLSFDDLVRQKIKSNSSDMFDFILIKKNQTPSYNFAVVVDDYLMKISHVVRGEEHISNTFKQILIYKTFGWKLPKFAHVSVIVDESGKKLSKRNLKVKQFVGQFIEDGYLPEALFNFLIFLGWHPKITTREIFTKKEIIDMFTFENLSKNSSFFDQKKLNWVNKQYLKKLSNQDWLNFVVCFLEKEYPNYNKKILESIALLYKKEISFGKEIIKVSEVFFKKNYILNDLSLLNNIESKEFIKFFCEELKTFFNKKNELNYSFINNFLKFFNFKKLNIKKHIQKKYFFLLIRLLTTTQLIGPSIKSTFEILLYLKKINYMIIKKNLNFFLYNIKKSKN